MKKREIKYGQCCFPDSAHSRNVTHNSFFLIENKLFRTQKESEKEVEQRGSQETQNGLSQVIVTCNCKPYL